ncbi:hypothetical protein Pfo_011521 [Paulownia fortunei]|nr:hypothetical protein Pfo_011521 [Paulownia fortunei]
MDQISSLSAKNANCSSEQEQYIAVQSSMSEYTKVHNESMDKYLLYCEYGHAKCFSLRKEKQAYFHDYSGEHYMKEFDCSCNGTKDEKRSAKNKQPIYLKMETRIGCTARLRVGPDQRYMLRSAYNNSFSKRDTLKALLNAGFSIANVYSYMQQESHGREICIILLEFSKLIKIIGYATFFRDGRCRIDYEAFGNVLLIDTTYKTNKYNLICAPFTGINHFIHNVMFGLSFMPHEIEATFQWLFNTFLKSMGGKQPKIIFTDQCQAIMNAIEIIFSDSHHRLCYLNNNSRFKNMFHKCMELCEYEEEFEDILRHKWSIAFSKNRFSVGLKATSRIEGTNSTLKDDGKRMHTLFECILRFERVQNKWRQDEKENDFKYRHGMPTLAVKTNCLLRDVAVIYTHAIYNMFQSEMINAFGINFDGQPSHTGTLSKFKVRSQGDSNRVRKVELDTESHEIKCICQYFESISILCKHALLVFKQMNVHKIPSRYIKRRWTKSVRERVSFDEEYLYASDHESKIVYVNHIMSYCYDLTMRSNVHPKRRNLVRNGLKSVLSNLNVLLDSLSMDYLTTYGDDMGLEGFKTRSLDAIEENNIIDDEHVCNPLYVESKKVNNTSTSLIVSYAISDNACGKLYINLISTLHNYNCHLILCHWVSRGMAQIIILVNFLLICFIMGILICQMYVLYSLTNSSFLVKLFLMKMT